MEKTTIQEKRQQLKDMSQQVKPLVKQELFDNVNEAVIATFYRTEGNTEFHTYRQWKEKGFQVRKGERAFFVWAKPLNALQEEQGKETDEESSRYFPLCFLFSNLQVEPIK
ncbi:MAG: ArdC-like ssDNA-binding domain-containing protein [Sediminibacterium sp.]